MAPKHPIACETNDFAEINLARELHPATGATQRKRWHGVHNRCGNWASADHAITIP
jgi:hypothetical protein